MKNFSVKNTINIVLNNFSVKTSVLKLVLIYKKIGVKILVSIHPEILTTMS